MNSIKDLLQSTLGHIVESGKSPFGIGRVPTGFEALDSILYGFDNSDLIVIGARPCMGKTALMISLALNIVEQNVPVLFYSFEMSNSQMMMRILSNRSGLEPYKIQNGRMAPEEWDKLMETCKSLNDLPLYISERFSAKIENFCEQAVKDIEATKAQIIFIDYLQLFSTKEKMQNRYEEVALCTRTLKHLARGLNIPIVVGSQINRNPEHRSQGHVEFYHPHMSDLRDSGTICEDANVVLLLDRPEVHHNSYEDECGNYIKGALEVKIAKNHMGRQDTVRLKFKPEVCRVDNWTGQESSIHPSIFLHNSDGGDGPRLNIESPF